MNTCSEPFSWTLDEAEAWLDEPAKAEVAICFNS